MTWNSEIMGGCSMNSPKSGRHNSKSSRWARTSCRKRVQFEPLGIAGCLMTLVHINIFGIIDTDLERLQPPRSFSSRCSWTSMEVTNHRTAKHFIPQILLTDSSYLREGVYYNHIHLFKTIVAAIFDYLGHMRCKSIEDPRSCHRCSKYARSIEWKTYESFKTKCSP